MSYEEYVERFQQVKQLQGGGSTAVGSIAGSGGKENGVAEEQLQVAAAGAAGAAAGGEGGTQAAAAGAGAGGGAGTNPATLSEEEYVQYCQRYAWCTA
jgi:hypothetical protein